MIQNHFRISHVLGLLTNTPLHAPLMHLTPCYIFHFSLRYSIAPANKLLGKDRINPGAARRRISCFLFLRFWCFECPYSERQHSIGGFVFSFLGGDLLLQKASFFFLPQGSQFGKE
jgi:hypothetical protein